MNNSSTHHQDAWYEEGWVWIIAAITIVVIWYSWNWYHTRISSDTPQANTYDCPSSKPIKGNAQSGIFHVPGSASYDRTKPERCFTDQEEAINAGYRASKK